MTFENNLIETKTFGERVNLAVANGLLTKSEAQHIKASVKYGPIFTTAKDAVRKIEEPKRSNTNVFSCYIQFYDRHGYSDEEWFKFEVDDSTSWRDKFLKLWDEYREENNLPEDGVVYVDAHWITIDCAAEKYKGQPSIPEDPYVKYLDSLFGDLFGG